MLSTSDLNLMPGIEPLRQRIQQMAAVTAVLSVDCGEPTFWYEPRWRKKDQVGAIKSGSGDELFFHFSPAGCFIKGFAHESNMTPYRHEPLKLWPGLLTSVPAEFQRSLKEPAFDMAATTFAIWRRSMDSKWHTDEVVQSDDPYGDGSADLLLPLTFTARQFTEWLSENYEFDVAPAIVESVFAGKPLTNDQLTALHPDYPLRKLQDAVRETGYPLA